LVNCPKCGNKSVTPLKIWTFSPRKSADTNAESKLVVGIFECPNCETRFRTAIQAGLAANEAVSIKNMVERIKGIRGELMQTLKNLREKIETLETERANLIIEIDSLRKTAESRVIALETEVKMMREEVRSLRDLLGYTEEPEKLRS
jgi:transcription elongation factor Elf1